MSQYIVRIWVGLIAMICGTALLAQPAQAADDAAMDTALHDLCGKRIVLLGEANTHGDGHTLVFKVKLIERLVNECHFKAVIFESSVYEFDHLDRLVKTGETITSDQVGTAVGGIWNVDVDVQPLFAFLAGKANRRKVTLGGVSDDIGGLGQTYSNDVLPATLTAHLEGADSANCREDFRQRIYWDFGDKPYGPDQKQALLGCLGRIHARLSPTDATDMAIVDSLERRLQSDQEPLSVARASYEHSMFLNLRQMVDRLPAGSKVVVWAATVHAGKAGATPDIRPMGSYVHETFGDRAFVLGFGALGGHYGLARQSTSLAVPPAPAGSLEITLLGQNKLPSVYIDAEHIKAFGAHPAALFGHEYVDRDWSQVVDGAVIFREETAEPNVPPAKP
jgi:erythromycin esterase-like protein